MANTEMRLQTSSTIWMTIKHSESHFSISSSVPTPSHDFWWKKRRRIARKTTFELAAFANRKMAQKESSCPLKVSSEDITLGLYAVNPVSRSLTHHSLHSHGHADSAQRIIIFLSYLRNTAQALRITSVSALGAYDGTSYKAVSRKEIE